MHEVETEAQQWPRWISLQAFHKHLEHCIKQEQQEKAMWKKRSKLFQKFYDESKPFSKSISEFALRNNYGTLPIRAEQSQETLLPLHDLPKCGSALTRSHSIAESLAVRDLVLGDSDLMQGLHEIRENSALFASTESGFPLIVKEVCRWCGVMWC